MDVQASTSSQPDVSVTAGVPPDVQSPTPSQPDVTAGVPPLPSSPQSHPLWRHIPRQQSELVMAIRNIAAALNQSEIIDAIRAAGTSVGSPQTPPFPTLSRFSSPPNYQSRHNYITGAQMLYLKHLEEKRTQIDAEEADLDRRCAEIETFHMTVLALYIGIIAGGTFLGGSRKDTEFMFEILTILGLALFLGTLLSTLHSYCGLKRLWWPRSKIWRREKTLITMTNNLSDQINNFNGLSARPDNSSITLGDAQLRLADLKSSFRTGPPYKRHNLFVVVQFLSCMTCYGVLLYWTFLVSTGKISNILFGSRGGLDLEMDVAT